MAGYGDAGLDETPRWRLSILFMVIVVLSLIGHIGLHMLEEYFRKHKRIGLKHTMQSLKDELFALGLITLLLITLQDQFVKICIDGGDDYDSDYGYDKKEDPYKGNRKLLAGTGSSYECPDGQESFWSVTVMHEIHILIFLIAVVHLAQAAISMVLASLRVLKWKKYEDRASHDMIPLKRKRAIKPKGSWCGLWMYSFIAQFSDSVDGPVYLAIRRLFLEKLELDDDFNFYKFVVDCMEEDFAKLVEFQWVMWLIAAVWIVLPWQAYTIIWLPCLFVLVMMTVGAKLQSVAIQLATLAYTHYNPHFIPHKERKRNLLVRGSNKIRKYVLASTSSSNLTQVAKQKQDSMNKRAGNGDSTSQSEHPQLDRTSIASTSKESITQSEQPPQLGMISQLPEQEQRPNLANISGIKSQKSVRVSEEEGVKKSHSQKLKPYSSNYLAEYMAQTQLLKDTSQLFWFSKPKLVLRVFQYVYFQSGLSIALLILDEWRGQQVNHLQDHWLYVVMIGVNVLLMVHAALFVIPTYAITVAAGAYGPENVLRKAIKRNVNPTLAKRLDLQRKSITSTQDSFTESVVSIEELGEEEAHAGHDHGHGHGHGHGDEYGPIKQLLQAMDNSQVRKKKLEEADSKSLPKAESAQSLKDLGDQADAVEVAHKIQTDK